jgi:hypothetical protein
VILDDSTTTVLGGMQEDDDSAAGSCTSTTTAATGSSKDSYGRCGIVIVVIVVSGWVGVVLLFTRYQIFAIVVLRACFFTKEKTVDSHLSYIEKSISIATLLRHQLSARRFLFYFVKSTVLVPCKTQTHDGIRIDNTHRSMESYYRYR